MNPNNKFCPSLQPSILFTCPDHPGLTDHPFTQELQRHRLQGILIDIHWQIGEKKHPAHRVVLSTSSPVLRAMLSQNWDPERKGVFELGDDVVDPNIADDILDFLYIRKVTITMENAMQLWTAANYLDLPTLKVATERFLTDHFLSSPDQVFDVYYFAAFHQLDSIHKSCTKFVFENYSTVLKIEKLVAFPEEFLVQLLKDLKGFESSIVNRTMFELLINWIKFDITTRSDSLFNLLEVFPFLEVSEKFIENNVLKEEMIVNSQDCLELVKDSLNQLSKHLYCVGELIFHFDVTAGKWTKISPMIHSRYSDFCSAAIGNKIYIFGGRLNYDDSNIVEVFDSKHNRWTELAPMRVGRDRAAAVALNGYIYVSGGYNDDSSEKLGSVDRYCVGTNQWTSVAPMIKTRAFHKMVSFNDFIFAIGGDYDGDKKTVEKYDPGANKWEMVPRFDLRYRDFTVLHQDRFFTFNLHHEHLIGNVDTVTIYDPLTDSTETFQDSGAVAVLNVYAIPKCVSVGDKIWALDHYGDMFGEFDPITRKWKKMDIDMSVPGKANYQVVVPQR